MVGEEGRRAGAGWEAICGYGWGISCSTLKTALSTLSIMNRGVL